MTAYLNDEYYDKLIEKLQEIRERYRDCMVVAYLSTVFMRLSHLLNAACEWDKEVKSH